MRFTPPYLTAGIFPSASWPRGSHIWGLPSGCPLTCLPRPSGHLLPVHSPSCAHHTAAPGGNFVLGLWSLSAGQLSQKDVGYLVWMKGQGGGERLLCPRLDGPPPPNLCYFEVICKPKLKQKSPRTQTSQQGVLQTKHCGNPQCEKDTQPSPTLGT